MQAGAIPNAPPAPLSRHETVEPTRDRGSQDVVLVARNDLHLRCCASAIRALPSAVLGPVDKPPWNRHRRFPGTTLMMHGAPARVLAQHLGRNLRFKGCPLCDAALEHLATPMPFLTGRFRACASSARAAYNGRH